VCCQVLLRGVEASWLTSQWLVVQRWGRGADSSTGTVEDGSKRAKAAVKLSTCSQLCGGCPQAAESQEAAEATHCSMSYNSSALEHALLRAVSACITEVLRIMSASVCLICKGTASVC
jgi:hypothetical protein